jgi:hypothetical protein
MWDEMVKEAGGKDPLSAYKPEDRNYKRAENYKKRIDELTAQTKPLQGGSWFELDRISLDKAMPIDPLLEKQMDEVQPPKERGH